MSALEISHTAESGTLLAGTARGDGSAEILRGRGWRFSRTVDGWYVPLSRDRAPRRDLIESTCQALSDAGFVVAVEIDTRPRAVADVEGDRHDRAVARAARLQQASERQETAADAAETRRRRIADGIPFGQPILVGHHSEGRHRRDLRRIQQADAAERGAREAADAARARAAAAIAADAVRTQPQVVARRIERLSVRRRATARTIEGYRNHLGDVFPAAQGDRRLTLVDELAELDARLAHWQGVRSAQVEEGEALELSRETVHQGDLIQYRGRWYPVLRSNAKSVSVRSLVGGSWTDTIPYHQLTGHRPAQP